MASTETICPHCGFSPIAEGAESCPRCRKRFVDDKPEATFVTATRAGGLTGSVTANPAPVALALTSGALLWVMRAGGFLVSVGDPPWAFALAALMIIAAMLLMTASGPAKHSAIIAGVVELVALALLPDAPAALTAICALHGVALIAATAVEPGRARLVVGGVTGSALGAVGLAVLAWAIVPKPTGGVVLTDAVAGYRLVLPEGWAKAGEVDLQPHLVLPWDGGKTVNVGFVQPAPRAVGVLSVSRDEQPALDEACRDALLRLGVKNPMPKLELSAPKALGSPAKLVELKTASGASGRFGCGVVGARLVTLAVVSQDPAPDVGAAAFELVAGGLELTE